MASEIPRPEYPRPEAMRSPDSWICLNGEWDFEFDPENKGMMENWYKTPSFSRKIIVPFVYQSKASGIDDQRFIEHVWYARTFTIPEEKSKSHVMLNFGAVDYECDVFVNGALVGNHYGGSTPFYFDITHFLTDNKIAEQQVVVHVHDLPFDQQLPRGKQSMVERFSGCDYEKVTGIWQTVWLEYVTPNYLDRSDYYIRADPWTGEITASINVGGEYSKDMEEYALECEIFDGDRSVSTIGYSMVSRFQLLSFSPLVMKVNPSKIELWSPSNPKLYDAHFRLVDGRKDDEPVVDEIHCTFGFREIAAEGQKLMLNKEPIYLKFALYQGYWVDGLWTAPSDEAIKHDLELLLEMGFNGARLHQKVEDPRLLYWADMMGVLLWGEMANSRKFTGLSRDLLLHEWTQAVRRDRCHPSIITWVPINETWGLLNQSGADEQELTRSLYHLTKGEDPTRLVNANDGYSLVDGATDLFSIHIYELPELFNKTLPADCPEDSEWASARYMKGGRYHGEPCLITEWGGWGMNLDEPYTKPDQFTTWGYQGILYPTWEEILALYKAEIEIFADRKWIVGHVYTEFCDQYQEMNGFLTFDRRPKGDLAILKQINDML
ncbi:MAG TPA: glycoside hydrolase family 2 TIM barrel-domain containing protein [Candidatus Lokiarchaeia archaeon]|nr:glycoside hydrolase family 2 TIM barrel-domain containing protein [Candidatus Lokiarchaeia archaeon]